jgi:release factor glutamine methyltransferase
MSLSAGSPAPTRAAALEAAVRRLRAAGVPDAGRDARLLLAAALGTDAGTLAAYPERPLTDAAVARFDAAIDARVARMPVSRILGRRGFWSLDLAIGPAVLDPRPDSETLVQAVLDRCPDRSAPLRLLDLGTGSGCLLLALLSELPNATGIGLERDPQAAEIARANAARCALDGRVEIRTADWAGDWAGLDGSAAIDVVVCNPPYIPSDEIDRLAPEVARYEPRGALDGGPDGLDAYRALAPRLPRLLARPGLAAFEVGIGQADAVATILGGAGLRPHPPLCDLAGTPRCVPATAG